MKIVRRALEEPLRQIVVNAGREPAIVLERVLAGTGNFGYNAATGEFGDVVAMGSHRSDQGHAARPAERRVDRQPDPDHRLHHRREAGAPHAPELEEQA